MHPTARLFQHAHRLTLFTRANCSLCTDARTVLARVWDKQPFEFEEIDVMTPGQQEWKDLYEFDTPVVHVEHSDTARTTSAARKLMHRFRESEVLQLMDDAGGKSE